MMPQPDFPSYHDPEASELRTIDEKHEFETGKQRKA